MFIEGCAVFFPLQQADFNGHNVSYCDQSCAEVALVIADSADSESHPGKWNIAAADPRGSCSLPCRHVHCSLAHFMIHANEVLLQDTKLPIFGSICYVTYCPAVDQPLVELQTLAT